MKLNSLLHRRDNSYLKLVQKIKLKFPDIANKKLEKLLFRQTFETPKFKYS